MQELWNYTRDKKGSFLAKNPDQTSRLYFPLMNEAGMKSSVTPELKGDISASFDKYLMPPVVTEDLPRTNNSRYVWLHMNEYPAWSLNGLSPQQQASKWKHDKEESKVFAQPGSYTLNRNHPQLPISAEITITVPNSKDKVELWKVVIRNLGEETVSFTPFIALPLFGRHADNLRDHRQVTSMFQIVRRSDYGVSLKPTIVHDESGHRENKTSYFVYAYGSNGEKPDRIWTRMQDFIGEGGSLSNPKAVFLNEAEPNLERDERNGVDTVAAMSFSTKVLGPGEEVQLVTVIGITENDDERNIANRYNSSTKFDKALKETQEHWSTLTGQVEFETGQEDFDEWTKWLAFQLKCRQIYGNSFLPDFGYGRGGRGWRDLWQDLLSIFLVDPDSAKNEIVNNLKGIRVDGSNATIIGDQPGEFKADRNNIPRTWCDHGAWPLFALNFYIQQTGDYQILTKKIEYCKDAFIYRSKEIDKQWTPEEGNWLLTKNGQRYTGTVLEHVLVQQLSAFYHVGEHNILLLEGADWNDTLDMARNRGESVCFQSFYAGNLQILVELLEKLKDQGTQSIELLEEISVLLDTTSGEKAINYNVIVEKRERLNHYFQTIRAQISGKKKVFTLSDLINDLKSKEDHSKQQIRSNEWIQTGEDKGYFNGHYDDTGKAMHGQYPEGLRMDLTSQVMPVMCNVAEDEQIDQLYRSARLLLGDTESPGMKLCTRYPDIDMNIGRITGFVYGHKEHGSKWMQQNIMFMHGLFHRNKLDAAYEMFHDIFKLSNDSGVSKTFPGIPSFYEPDNRGSYMYLTGSSTWIFLSLVTQVFGVRGEEGKLMINPKLSDWFFDQNNEAKITLNFLNQRIQVNYYNPNKMLLGQYKIKSITIDNRSVFEGSERSYVIDSEDLKSLGRDLIYVQVNLG